ncbi:MAG: tRNA epoxyqueuosine(34) reductase QueG [Ignavibacteria bacterium]|jgi:epoxyqueuosine reductase
MTLTDHHIKQQIRKKAKELGFLKTGFAKSEVLDKEPDQLSRWLVKGYDADMSWIKNSFNKRKNISLVLENAKTVISLAYYYDTPFKHDEHLPKISRYAWGKDYHKLIKSKLKVLSEYIENLFQRMEPEKIATKYYVDDGPVMDKAWAVRAGIGWMGKHTNIIDPHYGSWLFISEIITNIEFDTYDEPHPDLCGSCRICIDACPTGAIVDEYLLDANLCISYQTIENRKEIPEHIDLAGWIFGCDICQDVCPFNPTETDLIKFDSSFSPDLHVFNKSTEELEKIDEQKFNELFSDSPVKRTKYSGWKRNLERVKQ